MGYTKDTIKGISWTSGFRIFSRGISFLKNIILAKGLLTPSQFGVFGIGALILAFLEIITETGINIFLIQSKKDIREYIDSAWVISIVRGIIITAFIILSAPFIANFFNSPDAYYLLLIISIVPLIRGFINPAIINYQKELDFQKEFYLRSSIFCVDAIVAIGLALLTQSEFSLVFGLIAGAILEVILSFSILTPRPRIAIKKGYLSEILHHGKWVTGYGIFNYFAQQGDKIIIGRLLGTSSLGIYQMAYSFSLLPISEVCDVVSKVVFPIYAKISDDIERLRIAFIKTLSVTFAASLGLGIIIFIFTKDVIKFLGDQWLVAIPVIKILIIYAVLRSIAGPASALFLAAGKEKYVTFMTFIRFLGLIISIIPFVITFGLMGAAYSALLSVFVEIPVVGYFLYQTLQRVKK